MVIALFFLSFALADEPDLVDEVAAQVTDEVIVEEIIVHGDLLIERAKSELIHTLRADGFTNEIKHDDYVVLRNEASWKGELRLYDDGWAVMKRQPVQFHPRAVNKASDAKFSQWLGCIWVPSCLAVKGQTLGKRKWMAQKVKVLEKADQPVAAWGDLVADRELAERMSELDPKLYALWEEGAPLEGDGPVLATYRERRLALLRYWESRTETVWGDRVRLLMEGFIRDEVQQSENPFTPDEIDTLNARREGVRELDLVSTWAEVSATVHQGAF